MWETAIRALAAIGGIGFIGAVITALSLRRKVRAEARLIGADAAAVLTSSATRFADEVREAAREDNAALRRDLQDTRAEMAALRRHITVLETMLRRHLPPGVDLPDFVWPPPAVNGR